ncbi:hypothetical protein [Paenibacillus sp. Pae108]|nr:hypothetical protein [Paenibacillus sp. Pae108]
MNQLESSGEAIIGFAVSFSEAAMFVVSAALFSGALPHIANLLSG